MSITSEGFLVQQAQEARQSGPSRSKEGSLWTEVVEREETVLRESLPRLAVFG